MPFGIVRDDITRMDTDAIVNAANERLWMGGGVCGAIFRAAGADALQAACDEIGHCPTGSAVATPGFALSARYVIHAVGPVWDGGAHGEAELLARCYRSSLELAESLGCQSIAFPLISAGIYGFPRREALAIAQREIRAFLDTHDSEMEVVLVLYDASTMAMADSLRLRVERFIDDVYVGRRAHRDQRLRWERRSYSAAPPEGWASASTAAPSLEDADAFAAPAAAPVAPSEPPTPSAPAAPVPTAPVVPAASPAAPSAPAEPAAPLEPPAPADYGAARAPAAAPRTAQPRQARGKRTGLGLPFAQSLKQLLQHLDAGFSETLLTLIDERGLTDAQVYKKANLSRQHFSKIRSNPRYQPTKATVLALAVALELTLDETQMLLKRAGFALSHADCRDVIVEFFIREGNYDIFEINNALFSFDQPLLR